MTESPPPLDKVDPAAAWKAWKPDDKQPWNLKWAGHLYRRAAFGGSPEELTAAVEDGLAATLDRLLQGDKGTGDFYALLFPKDTKFEAGMLLAKNNSARDLGGWWLYAMHYSPHPLLEKMTLFWHNHFVSSIAKVGRTPLMYEQNKCLRRNALGKFGPFLLEISKDPAMLVYLDSNSNVKGKPNENYAREVMELFSLGVGNYTEKDVREAARAFTGWHTTGASFEFSAKDHDSDEKTFLGKTGAWDGEDIVRIILEQPACARFLVRKLYRYFISETDEPPAALLEPLAEALRKSQYDIAALVGTILRSRHFFSDYAYHRRVKSPVEFALGAVRAIAQRQVNPNVLIGRIDAMGQELFAPPNVKGWPGGKSWLNTATVLARHNFAEALASGTSEINQGGPIAAVIVDPDAFLRREKITDPDKILDRLAALTLQDELSDKARARLQAFFAEGKPEGDDLSRRVREAMHALMCMPEFQLA
jgi:uncharacterized protein (DUF1800 family)